MGASPIQWTGHTVNPLRARLASGPQYNKHGRELTGHYCEKIGPGCKHCYSSTMQKRFKMPAFQEQRHVGIEHFIDPSKFEEVMSRKIPTKYFWCDMTDMFGDWVPNDWIAACFGVMAATPWHTHQVLTKRASRLPEFFTHCVKRGEQGARLFPDDDLDWRIGQYINVMARRAGANMNADERQNHGGPWPLPNVWIGVTCEDQKHADERIPLLLETPAAVRFVSVEPMLGPVNFSRAGLALGVPLVDGTRWFGSKPGLDWVIFGGESGRKARPLDVQWIRDGVRQCREAGVAAFVKQLGADPHDSLRSIVGGWCPGDPEPDTRVVLKDSHGGDMSEWPEPFPREFPRAA